MRALRVENSLHQFVSVSNPMTPCVASFSATKLDSSGSPDEGVTRVTFIGGVSARRFSGFSVAMSGILPFFGVCGEVPHRWSLPLFECPSLLSLVAKRAHAFSALFQLRLTEGQLLLDLCPGDRCDVESAGNLQLFSLPRLNLAPYPLALPADAICSSVHMSFVFMNLYHLMWETYG